MLRWWIQNGLEGTADCLLARQEKVYLGWKHRCYRVNERESVQRGLLFSCVLRLRF